jgi:hypothetical protein
MDDHHLYQLCQKIEGRKYWFGGGGGFQRENVKIHMTSEVLIYLGFIACSTHFTMYIYIAALFFTGKISPK